MLPILLAGAAALLTTGCGVLFTQRRENSSEDLSSPSPPLAADTEAHKIYSQLKNSGVADDQLDRGCRVNDFDRPGPNGVVVGEGDGKIQPCEAYAYTVENYQKYRNLVEGLAGGPIPWEINDLDPATDFDQHLRDKVDDAIFRIGQELVYSGEQKESPSYRRQLALGLFHFILFPKDPDAVKSNLTFLEDFKTRTEELLENHLPDFRRSLFREGGLGLAWFQADETHELTALEALKQNQGECSERSFITYGILQRAGLEPFFVYSNIKGMKSFLENRNINVPFNYNLPVMNGLVGHVLVGIPLSEGYLYLDPSMEIASDSPYDSYYHVGLHQALAMYLNNKAMEIKVRGWMGARSQAMGVLQGGLNLDPTLPGLQENYNQMAFEEGLREF